MKKKVNRAGRRRAIKKILWFLLLPAFWFNYRLADNFNNRMGVKKYKIPIATLNEVNFFEKFIVIRKDNKFKVLSSKCTHLGCKINNADSENLICSCHGSKFNFSGNVIQGPANQPLPIYKAKITNEFLIIDTETSS